jgi:lactoylglutathione lyase
MRTLFVAYRVTDLSSSLAFYSALGYVEVSRVTVDVSSRLVLLQLPDEPAASLELVHRPSDGPVDVGSGFDHLAIEVDALETTLAFLSEAGLQPGPPQYPAGPDGPRTSWLTDPDGYPIELVEWPPAHAESITVGGRSE